MTRCGFISILGAPNVGKSTLVNQLAGTKISIVSPKVQTTRQRILGIVIKDQSQLILVDTPGIFTPQRRLERAMVSAAWDASKDADILVILVDVTEKNFRGTFAILEKIAITKKPLLLVLNKIDCIKKNELLEIAHQFSAIKNISQTLMISALTGDGVQDLANVLAKLVPEGPWLYPEDQLMDLPQRLWAAEITREQLYLQLHQELPYQTFVETESWEEFDNGDVKISQVIIVSREGQKAIVLGKKGTQIKAISQAARQEMQQHLERKVHLFLYVKVVENWGEKADAYRLMGLNFNA